MDIHQKTPINEPCPNCYHIQTYEVVIINRIDATGIEKAIGSFLECAHCREQWNYQTDLLPTDNS